MHNLDFKRSISSKWLVVLFILLLQGCASIPLTTMAKFSGFGPEDILQLKASELRVKATVNESLGLDLVQATSITLGVNTEQGEVSLNLSLQAHKQQTIPAKEGLFSSAPAFSVQTMKLSKQGIADFEKFQQLVKNKSIKGGRFSAGLDNQGQRPNRVEETVYFSVAIKLAAQDEFTLLIDQFEIETM